MKELIEKLEAEHSGAVMQDGDTLHVVNWKAGVRDGLSVAIALVQQHDPLAWLDSEEVVEGVAEEIWVQSRARGAGAAVVQTPFPQLPQACKKEYRLQAKYVLKKIKRMAKGKV